MKLQSAKTIRTRTNNFAYDKFHALDSDYAKAEVSTTRTRNASATLIQDNDSRPPSVFPQMESIGREMTPDLPEIKSKRGTIEPTTYSTLPPTMQKRKVKMNTNLANVLDLRSTVDP